MHDLTNRIDNPLAVIIAIIVALYALLTILMPVFLFICAHEISKLRKINAELLEVMRLRLRP